MARYIFQSTHSTIASVEKIKLRTVTQPQTESYPVEEELVSTPINNMWSFIRHILKISMGEIFYKDLITYLISD